MERNVDSFMRDLEAMVARKIQHGLNGININAFKRNEPPVFVNRQHEMSEYIANLAGTLYKNKLLNDHKAWVHWMMDAAILRPGGDNVTVFHRSKFYIDHARDLFGEMLEKFFACKVKWEVSHEIARQVERQNG